MARDKFEDSQVGASTSFNPMKTVQESFGSFLKTPVKNSSGSSTSTSTNSTLPKSLDDWYFGVTKLAIEESKIFSVGDESRNVELNYELDEDVLMTFFS